MIKKKEKHVFEATLNAYFSYFGLGYMLNPGSIIFVSPTFKGLVIVMVLVMVSRMTWKLEYLSGNL